MVKQRILAIFVLFGLVGGPATPASASSVGLAGRHGSTVVYEVPGKEVFPEGVAFDERTGFFYVSGALDGTIYRGRLDRRSLEVFLPGGSDGRTDANGLKVDARGRLYVAGGASGMMFVYDTRSGALIRKFGTGRTDGFINDVAFDRRGDAYFTDSLAPVLWRVPAASVWPAATDGDAEAFLDLDGTAVRYEPGFNLNGIVGSADGNALYTVQYNTGKLFRISLPQRTVAPVRVTGADLLSGDGMLRRGNLLLINVPDRAALDTVRLDGPLDATGMNTYTDRTFRYPTTAAFARDRVLVVNSQFDKLIAGLPPEIPFTVSGVRIGRALGSLGM